MKKLLLFLFVIVSTFANSQITPLNIWQWGGNSITTRSVSVLGTKNNQSLFFKTNINGLVNSHQTEIDSFGYMTIVPDTNGLGSSDGVALRIKGSYQNNAYIQLNCDNISAYRLKHRSTGYEWFLQNQTFGGGLGNDAFAIGVTSNPSASFFQLSKRGESKTECYYNNTLIIGMQMDSAGHFSTGSTTPGAASFRMSQIHRGGATGTGIFLQGSIATDVTTAFRGILVQPTYSGSVSRGAYTGIIAGTPSMGTNTLTTLIYYDTGTELAAATVTGSTYGIFCRPSRQANVWGFYENGTALNYFAGPIGIGSATTIAPNSTYSFAVNGRVNQIGLGESTFFGRGAGVLDALSSQSNTAFGDSCLSFNVSGVVNTAFGQAALKKNIGSSNSSFGYNSGRANTSGGNNAYFGESAGRDNTSGANNTALGKAALLLNVGGGGNVAIGFNAGRYNTAQHNRLYINGIDRATAGADSTNSIIYGYQANAVPSQTLYLNANVRIPQTLSVSSTATIAGITNITSSLNVGTSVVTNTTNNGMVRIKRGVNTIDIGAFGDFGDVFGGLWLSSAGTPTTTNYSIITGTTFGTYMNAPSDSTDLYFQGNNDATPWMYISGKKTSGSTVGWQVNTQPRTRTTAAANGIKADIGCGTSQWLTGTVPVHYGLRVRGTTISAFGASNFTDVYSQFNVKCVQSTNATIVNNWGFGTDGMAHITSSVLIGTTARTPLATLDVAGSASVSLTFTAEGGIVTDNQGTNALVGNATLVGGSVVVSNTVVDANSYIVLTRKTSGGTPGTAITYTISNGVSFTITSDNILDTSTFTWYIIKGH